MDFDDAVFFSKNNNNSRVKLAFTNLLSDIKHWSKTSGASLSLSKCKTLHICNKHYCNPPTVIYNNFNIENKFNFSHHCINLKKKLTSLLYIIKYLSSKKSSVHTNTLLNVTKALILPKIDYGIQIYSCQKSI